MSETNDRGKQFRQALGAFVTGVTIVTTVDAEGRPVGLTANSFNSVSLDPPMVLWSLALNSGALSAFRNAKNWAVHVLAAGQEDLSSRFASRGAEKFAGLEYEKGPDGVPLLEGYAARFVCRATFEYEGGDHAIFVGEVIDHDQRPVQPLIFHGGRYGQVMPPVDYQGLDEAEDVGQFGRHFIAHSLALAYQTTMKDVRQEYRARGLKAAEYTVVAALGLGADCTREELRSRAANGGVPLPDAAIDSLLNKHLLDEKDQRLRLTDDGNRLLVELVAVAQSTQLRVEDKLNAQELGLLYDLLQRVAGA